MPVKATPLMVPRIYTLAHVLRLPDIDDRPPGQARPLIVSVEYHVDTWALAHETCAEGNRLAEPVVADVHEVLLTS